MKCSLAWLHGLDIAVHGSARTGVAAETTPAPAIKAIRLFIGLSERRGKTDIVTMNGTGRSARRRPALCGDGRQAFAGAYGSPRRVWIPRAVL